MHILKLQQCTSRMSESTIRLNEQHKYHLARCICARVNTNSGLGHSANECASALNVHRSVQCTTGCETQRKAALCTMTAVFLQIMYVIKNDYHFDHRIFEFSYISFFEICLSSGIGKMTYFHKIMSIFHQRYTYLAQLCISKYIWGIIVSDHSYILLSFKRDNTSIQIKTIFIIVGQVEDLASPVTQHSTFFSLKLGQKNFPGHGSSNWVHHCILRLR